MRWQRRRPLWPLVAALTLLLMLAVDAPRNWQSAGPEISAYTSDRVAVIPSWNDILFPPKFDNLEPITSPVLDPTLPPVEQPVLPAELDNFEFLAEPQTESLPRRAEFDLGMLMEIRDSLGDLVGKLPKIPDNSPAPAGSPTSAPSRVVVTGPQDRLAMRSTEERVQPAPIAPHVLHQRRLEEFADVMLETIRRHRSGQQGSLRVALRSTGEPQDQPRPSAEQPAAQSELVLLPSADDATAEQVVSESQEVASEQPVNTSTVEPVRESQPQLRFYPQALVDRLATVTSDSPAHAWSIETLTLVCRLAEETNSSPEEAAEVVRQLQKQVDAGRGGAEQVADHALRQHWLRMIQSLDCRTAIWQRMFDPELQSLVDTTPVTSDEDARILPTLNEIVALLEGNENGDAWREYLLLDQVAAASSIGAATDPKGRRKLAQEVLSRMNDPRLTEAQREFVVRAPVHQLRECMLPWAQGPIDLETLAALVERYDAKPDARYAAALAQLKQRLQWSPVAEYQQLAEHLDGHYRGANMRVALSEQLLSRMLPAQRSSFSPVNDSIAGTKVKGRSRTTVKLQTKMIPNDHAWQIALVAKGAVLSKTRSDTWPASVNNSAKMFYEARKTVLIDSQGLRVSRTRATARGRNELVGIDTDFDPIPILSHLVRDAARRKHKKSRGLAHKQVKAKVVRQAKSRMDRDADPKLRRLEQKFADNILISMEKLALVAEPLEMYTTSDRAIMLLRLANSLQLASNSLRPLAPSDSLASLQLHESVLNNAIAGLGLEGRRMSALELHHFITSRLGRPEALAPDDLPARAKIEFAPFNAVRVHCRGDQLELVLNIREVAHGRDKIRNFTVHAHFRPTLNGLDVRLIREGTLQFEGRNLRTGPRVVLHSVFGKLLRKDQEVRLLKEGLADDPRLDGLMVTQLVIDDGWIGLALGPQLEGRTAWRSLPHATR